MRNLKFLFTVLFLAVLGMGNAWATEVVYKTAKFGSAATSGSSSGYTTTWNSVTNGFSVSVANGNTNGTNWAMVKFGRKGNASVGSITTSTAIDKKVTKVVINIDAITAANVNSIKLYSGTTAECSTEVGEYSKATGSQTVTLSNPTANLFYKVVFDCKSGSGNGFVAVKTVEYYYDNAEDAPSGCSTPTISFADGAEVAKLTTDAAFTNAASVEFNSVATGQAITYSVEAGKEGVATVNATTGEVTIVGAGEAKIYASVTAEGDYCEKDAYYTLTVTEPAFECGAGSTEFALGSHADFSGLSSSYAAHTFEYTEADVVCASVTKQSSTITDCPVTKGGAMEVKANNGRKITSIHFEFKQWTTKAQTATLLYSTDGGENYSAFEPAISSAKFALTCASLPANTDAVKVTFSSSSNQIGLVSICAVYTDPVVSSVATPELSVAAGTYEGAKNVKVSNYDAALSYFYTLDGTAPTNESAAYDDAAGIDVTKSATLKVIAYDAESNASDVASAAYVIIPVYASLADLVAADLTSGTMVKVSFENVAIKSIFVTTAGYRNGIYFDIQKENKDIEIYYQNVPTDWAVNGTVSGTMTCEWKVYNDTWELAPVQGSWNWNNLTYVAPTIVREQATITASYKTSLVVDDEDNVYAITYNGDGELSVLSSNPAVATIALDGTTITVHPVAAGSTTITISAPQTDAYTAVSKTYTLTVKPGLTAAALTPNPFYFDGGKADMTDAGGIKNTGLGTDYPASPKLKFDNTGDEVIIRVAEAIKKVEYSIKGNSYTAGQFDILQSVDGKTYSALKSYTDDMPASATKETTAKPATDTRYIKFVYTTKNVGNVALGAIKIYAASELDDPELAFDQASYVFFTTATEKQIVAASAAGSEGAITYALTEGDADAFSIDETTGVITCETAGTYTITATIAAAGAFATQSVNVVVTIIEPESLGDPISIVFPYADTYYAMKKDLSVVEVLYGNNKLINVAEADKEDLIWYKKEANGNVTFCNADGMYLGTGSSNSIVLSETAVNWTLNSEGNYYCLASATTRTFILRGVETIKNYAVSNAGKDDYSEKPVFATGFVTIFERELNDKMGTHCYEFTIPAGEYTGAHFYVPAYREGNVKIFWDEVAADEDIEAGKPYLVVPAEAGAKLQAVTINVDGATAQTVNGFVGSFSQKPINANEGNYIVYNNAFRLVGNNVAVGAHRAYIHLEGVKEGEVPLAPGRRRIVMNNADTNTATALENVSEEFGAEYIAKKVMINGTLYILRGAEKFTVEGKLVK